jgi:hypothetical protein
VLGFGMARRDGWRLRGLVEGRVGEGHWTRTGGALRNMVAKITFYVIITTPCVDMHLFGYGSNIFYTLAHHKRT